MKLLLTGAAGQVGLEVQRRSALLPWIDLVATDLKQLDITDAGAVLECLERERPALVINAAAYTAVDRAEEERELAQRINADGPANLARGCAKLGAALFHISTDYVYDGSKPGPYLETDPVHPMSVYGLTKALGDTAVEQALAAAADGLCRPAFVILRTAWVYSQHGTNFVKTMLRLARERDRLAVVADQQGNPTSAGDIAQAMLQLASRLHGGEPLPGGLYHYAGRGDTTWHAFATAILERGARLGLIPRLPEIAAIGSRDYPTRVTRPANSRLDCSRFDQTFPDCTRPEWSRSLDLVLSELQRQPG